MSTRIDRHDYGTLANGRIVHEYRLDNGRGLQLSAITYGGIVTALHVPDARGRSANVVLGFDNLTDYVERNPHFGIIVGRYANRIAGGRFMLDGQPQQLTLNDGPNCLHGGERGFGRQLWQGVIEGDALRLDYRSKHGEEGFPGQLDVSVRYSLGADDMSWRIDYEARCDRPTLVNLSHHDFFNLAGCGSALGHRLTIPAQRYCEVDRHLIPSALVEVTGTPFDFREATVIDERLRDGHPQLVLAKGYDHNWMLDDGGSALHLAARLEDPQSGRVMTITTTEPALQFYSGNFLDGSLRGSQDQLYRQGDGLCLETQHAPDSPNRPDWPSTVLRPGETYRSSTVHRFS